MRHFFESLTSGEKISSICYALCTWFYGILLFESPLLGYAIKGLMWLGGLAISAFIPKIIGTYYEHRLKDRLDKYFKTKKDAKYKKSNNKKAA